MYRLSDKWEHTITFNTGRDTIEDLVAIYDLEVETYPDEPTPWGHSRGNETTVNVELISVQLGGLKAPAPEEHQRRHWSCDRL